MEKRLVLLLVVVFTSLSGASAQGSDFGMWYELGVEKKLTPKWNLGVEGEFRTRNNTRTVDRWSAGLSAEYKMVKGLKATTGYTFLYDNNPEEMDFKRDGFMPNHWTPSYFGARHRFHVGLTGSTELQRFKFSLRERFQYTYRPEALDKKYDFDELSWKPIKGKGKSVLRSRLQVAYDIAHWKFDPTVGVEMFNDKSGIQKMRYQVSIDYKYRKQHVFSLSYRFQDVNSDDDDNDKNRHLVGLGYAYKF
jgi:hypothetical protein